MSLTSKEVAEITRLLDESVFDELRLEFNGLKLEFRRAGAPPPAAAREHAAPQAQAAVPEAAAADIGVAAGLHEVTAPLLGTFYRAPKPGAPPFVESGSSVDEDTIIGIIEVMKLMNSVRAGIRGQVIEICGRDGALVEYGETLLRIAKAD